MPRRETSVDEPFYNWFVTVDDYNRIRLPLNVSSVVRWIDLKSGNIECAGVVGPWGGVQLVPLTSHRDDVRRLVEAIGDAPPGAWESAHKWVNAARFLATAWPISINVESSRISITLPEASRRAQQLPQPGGTVVVFGFGDILEIWEALKWHDHVRETAQRKASAISDALDELEQR